MSRNLQDFKDGSYRFSASLESLESVRVVDPSFRCAWTAEGILNRVEQSVHRDGLISGSCEAVGSALPVMKTIGNVEPSFLR